MPQPAPNPQAPSRALLRKVTPVDSDRLRVAVRTFLDQNRLLVKQLTKHWLVLGKDVVRYHADTEDEEASQTEESEESESEDDGSDSEVETPEMRRIRKLEPIAVAKDAYTDRIAACETCDKKFDVAANKRGDCRWHDGVKTWYNDDGFWDEHDEERNGSYESCSDKPEFAQGFRLDCCDVTADDEDGCRKTRHRAKVNIIVDATGKQVGNPRKRKAEDVLERPPHAICDECDKRYWTRKNHREVCSRYHPGEKTLDRSAEWADHYEECDGRLSDIDPEDSDYEDGMMWDCCKKPIQSKGCEGSVHVAQPGSITR